MLTARQFLQGREVPALTSDLPSPAQAPWGSIQRGLVSGVGVGGPGQNKGPVSSSFTSGDPREGLGQRLLLGGQLWPL